MSAMHYDSLKRNRKATVIVFVAVPILIALLVFLFLKQMYLDQEQGITLAKHSYEVREQLLELRNDLIQSATGQNIFRLTGSHSYLQPSLFAESDAFVRLTYLPVLLADRPAQLARFNRLRPLIERILAENRGADSSKMPSREEKMLQTDLEPRDSFLPEQIGGIIREMQEDEDEVLSVRVKVSHGISEQAFEGVMGMVGKDITVSGNRADKFNIPSAQPDVTPGS